MSGKHAARVAARAIACGLLLTLPACRLPQLRQAETGTVVPETFNGTASPDSSAKLRADEFYSDPLLVALMCQALAGNRELKILEEEIQIARNEVLTRRGSFLPLIGLRGRAGLDTSSAFMPLGAAERQLQYRPGRNFPDPPGDFGVGLNILAPIDIWRELRNARDAAVQRYNAAVERRNDFVTKMVADVAENYYTLMALDKRMDTLNQIIDFQQKSLTGARLLFEAGRITELPVQRFEAEVRKNQSEKLIVRQEVIEAENRINFIAGRVPQPVDRNTTGFLDLTIHSLSAGVPAQLLQNRPDVRQAERELMAAGLDVKVARAHFFPRVDLTATVGTQAFALKYLFNPESLVATAAGELSAPLINKAAIRAEYRSANARQLEAVYSYQRTVLSAVTEVVNRLAMVENYTRSIEIKNQQLVALEKAVVAANSLFQAVNRLEYLEVLTVQRDLLEARTVLINTKRQQLSAVVNAYQALGGGSELLCLPTDPARVLPDAQPGAEPRKDMKPPVPPPAVAPAPGAPPGPGAAPPLPPAPPGLGAAAPPLPAVPSAPAASPEPLRLPDIPPRLSDLPPLPAPKETPAQ